MRCTRYTIYGLIFVLAGFCLLCGWLVVESGLFCNNFSLTRPPCILLQQAQTNDKADAPTAPAKENIQLKAAPTFSADNAAAEILTLGSIDPNKGFEFQLELSTKGAAIRKATFSGFDDRDYKNPQPLVILSPVELPGGEVLSMANTGFLFVPQDQQLPLNKLDWRSFGVEKAEGGLETVRFEAIIKDGTGQPVVILIKTYKVDVGSYLLSCDIIIENLSNAEQKVRFNMEGPVGIGREEFRNDLRKVVAGFRDSNGKITSTRIDIRKLNKANKTGNLDARRLSKPGDDFLWTAVVNKYFTAIIVPVPDEGKNFCDWVTDKIGTFYNPDEDGQADSGDETIGLDLKIASTTLAAKDQAGSTKTYNFQIYLGPKDKSLFDKNQLYRDLGFVQTIDFQACFCPVSIISPLTFMVLAMMKWMHSFIPNYGVVIIILVFLVRIILHPLTKKSQVSMNKMSKLGPLTEQIRKNYANNKAEMNKQIMALYKKQGASPIMGFLPMMVQMPVLIALWSAIYASIDLRGASFLPFWITDLSAPDALYRFSTVTIPLLGAKVNSLNLLPILMGVAMYLQQKLMPAQPAASPQAAQQQKMMMIMMPLFFPLILYNGPSGVNLYFMASTFAGVIEQHVIKKHIREKEEAEKKGLVAATSKTGGKVKKKKPKPFYKF